MNHPCSACGSRTRTPGCQRCLERELSLAGSAEQRLRFEQEEVERLARVDQHPPERPPHVPLDVALVGSGIPAPRAVALVSCGKAKLDTTEAVCARDLYIGNPFKLSLRYAIAVADDVQILSALHGLINPFEPILPYNFTMPQMTRTEQDAWGRRVVQTLKSLYPLTHLRLIFLAGQDYIRPVVSALAPEDRAYWAIENPLLGLGLFQRIRWLSQALQHLEET